jgi:hypothetical protein
MQFIQNYLANNMQFVIVLAVCVLATGYMVWFLTALLREQRTRKVNGIFELKTIILSNERSSNWDDAQRHVSVKPTGMPESCSLAPRSAEVNIYNDKPRNTRPIEQGAVPVSRQRICSRTLVRASWIFVLLLFLNVPLFAQSAAEGSSGKSADDEVRQLRLLVERLESRVAQLEEQQEKKQESQTTAIAAVSTSSGQSPVPASQILSQDDRGTLDFLKDTTLNLTFDGYYGYNFNRPIGRVNLLRAYDVSSNSFSISQATVILERAPDPSQGRRFGARLDLQYGQATETLQGSAVNELRPQAYRPIFQAYGTYVAPLGSGLTIDFGKWASALGPEGNYSKDQANYSRSYFFNFLPFYHMGLRAAYNVNSRVTLAYWLVNGANQTEDFNGFKSQNFEFVYKPSSSFTWTSNYYFGEEGRDVVAILNPGLPSLPTQPGLPVANVSPVPNGREHIFDNYFSWSASKKLTLGGEFDYVINRQFENSAPAHVTGGAAYAHYQVTPKVALAARSEYLSDRGGLFSGVTQALKETTMTYEYKIADGLVSRVEWRRDFSNQPFFLTETPNVLKKEQNTATLGLIWWWGRKTGSW